MKRVLFLLTLVTGLGASAADPVPAYYCVSTHRYAAITQLSLFTNAKGTVRISAEVVSQEGYLGDTNSFALFQRTQFDKATNTISNKSGTFELKIETSPLDPNAARELFKNYIASEEDVDTGLFKEGEKVVAGSGHHVSFKRYYKATLTKFDLKKAPKDSWMEAFNESFQRGNTEYVCGNVVDMEKATANSWATEE